jgi:hypothetical protein
MRDTESANPRHHVQLEKIPDENDDLYRVSRIVDAPLSSKVNMDPATPENIAKWHAGVARIEAAQANHQGYQSPYPQGRPLRDILRHQGRFHL